MSTILDEPFERPRTSSGTAEDRTTDARTATSYEAASESGTTSGPARRGFENTLTQTSNHNRPSESFRWTMLGDRFDGLRIPSSPLHEF